MKKHPCLVGAAALATLLLAGCESDDHAKPDPYFEKEGHAAQTPPAAEKPSSDIVGTWSLSPVKGEPWFIHFAADGTWKITDDAKGTKRRVFGSYTYAGGRFSGDMKNPGVGEGEINGTIAGSSISLDFVEYWHTPHKHVPYTGEKTDSP